MRFGYRFIFPFLIGLILFGGETSWAAQPNPILASEVQNWGLVLKKVDDYIKGSKYDEWTTENHRVQINQVRRKALATKRNALEKQEFTQRLLNSLGPPPEKGKPPEPKEIVDKRGQYANELVRYRAWVAQADLALTRADELEKSLSSISRARLVAELLKPYPPPFYPSIFIAGVSEFFEKLHELIQSPLKWNEGLSAGNRQKVTALIWPTIFMILVAFLIGWGLRVVLLRRLGRDPTVENPSYAQRIFRAIVEGFARGIIPAAIISVFAFWASQPEAMIEGQFSRVIQSAFAMILFFVLVVASSRSLLAPELPPWRLLAVSPENALKIHKRMTIFAGILSVDLFLQEAGDGLQISDSLVSVYTFLMITLEAIAMVSLSQPDLWVLALDGETKADEEGLLTKRTRIVLYTRRTLLGISVIAVGATLVGYTILGEWLLSRLFLSGVVCGFFALASGLLHELFDAFFHSEYIRTKTGLQPRTMTRLHSWLRLALNPLLVIFSFLLIVPLWGFPRQDLIRLIGKFFTGFSVGNIWISISDISLAFVVFFVVMAVFRIVQRIFVEQVLAQTGMPSGVQYSLSTGFGYVGVVFAILISIAVTGANLTNLAVVAGALSVGIGFGLQNVVNNFVSGLILLVERPIKVGDWVVVGSHEGFVKRISFRATELDTWQRASVIIPNAEIISTSVINLTHKDNFGRIEIRVGVAYGSNTKQVREILLECAQEHSEVVDYPSPIVLFWDFGTSSLDFELRCFTDRVTRRLPVGSDLRFEIDRRFREEGIHIPFPQRVLHFSGDDNQNNKNSPESSPEQLKNQSSSLDDPKE